MRVLAVERMQVSLRQRTPTALAALRRSYMAMLAQPGLPHAGCDASQQQAIPNAVTTTLTFPLIQVFGSNTDVGKTVFSTGLCRAALRSSLSVQMVGYIKPLQTGAEADHDARFLQRHLGDDYARLHAQTLFSWDTPVSPHLAAQLESKVISDETVVAKLSEALAQIQEDASDVALTIIETAGGVCSPSASGRFQCDVYRPFRLPVVLVGDGKLGGISATMSALDSLLLRGYDVIALVLIEQDELANANAIRARATELRIPVFPLMKLPAIPTPLTTWYNETAASFTEIFQSIQTTHTERIRRFVTITREAQEVQCYSVADAS
jgi:dethiobiotin synthetase/adenosylmethionine--8-amino-7-oxononanoate aminotransferase